MKNRELGGFNTTLQQVDQRYSWINEMIRMRQVLVLDYMKLLNVSLDKSSGDEGECYPSYEDISTFCNHLIDYVSHGAFDLYPKILELMENASGRSLSIARRAMPRIEHSRDFIMRFNDRYGEDLNEGKMKTLKKDLSELGKCLEQHFRNEDRLIIGLRLVHSIIETQTQF